MATILHSGKYIVAAGLIAVGFSIPLGAETLDEMFDALQSADSEEAGRIEERIFDRWTKSGSAAMDLLVQRGEDALEAEDFNAAIEHLTAAIDHAPGFAQAYNMRATAYYLSGYYGPALDDLRQAMVINPRHFYAMIGFAVMLEELGKEQEALEVYRQITSIHPHQAQALSAIERLELKFVGQPL